MNVCAGTRERQGKITDPGKHVRNPLVFPTCPARRVFSPRLPIENITFSGSRI